jgi:hypothetical protein
VPAPWQPEPVQDGCDLRLAEAHGQIASATWQARNRRLASAPEPDIKDIPRAVTDAITASRLGVTQTGSAVRYPNLAAE